MGCAGRWLTEELRCVGAVPSPEHPGKWLPQAGRTLTLRRVEKLAKVVLLVNMSGFSPGLCNRRTGSCFTVSNKPGGRGRGRGSFT